MDTGLAHKIRGLIGCIFIFILNCPANTMAKDYSAEAGVKIPIGSGEQTQEKSPKESQEQLPSKTQKPPAPVKIEEPTDTVKSVIRGNILELDSGVKVLLIGIDCPKVKLPKGAAKSGTPMGQDDAIMVSKGKRAVDFTREIVEGRKIRLEYGAGRMDKHNQLLAYVFVATDLPKGRRVKRKFDDYNFYTEGLNSKEIFLNATLVAAGYAQEAVKPPDVKYQKLFGLLQQNARTNKRGFWG